MPGASFSMLLQWVSAAVAAPPASVADPTATTWSTVWFLLPELLLILACAKIYIGGAFKRSRVLWNIAALVGLVAAGAIVAWQSRMEWSGATGPIAPDALGWLGRSLAIAFGFLLIVAAWNEGNPGLGSEYVGSILAAVVGGMLAAQARDLVLLFVGLELVSIPTYVILFLGRKSAQNQEATAKYFFLSILSSAVLLYGISFIYGISGSTMLPEKPEDWQRILSAAGEGHGLESLAPFAAVLLVAGLGFKIAIAPFHFYAPDVYQGTSSTNAAVLAVIPKLAGMVALVRLAGAYFSPEAVPIWQIVVVLAVATMTIGNVSALWQNHLRRLLAFSSIAHGGYLLIGLAAALAPGGEGVIGVSALLFYLVVYALAALGAFAVVSSLRGSDGREIETVDDVAGLGKSSPLVACLLAVFLFSLAGVPPLGGFWGKFGLFASAVRIASSDVPESPWFIALSLCGAINAAIAAAYYLRVVAVMFFQKSEEADQVDVQESGGFAAGIACSLLILAIGVAPGILAESASEAGKGWAGSAPRPSEPVAAHAAK